MQIVLTIFRLTCPNHMQIVVTSVSIWIGIGYRVKHSLIYCNFWNHICHRKTNWTCFIGKVGFDFHRMPIIPIECRFSKFKLQLYENFKMQWIPLHNSCVCVCSTIHGDSFSKESIFCWCRKTSLFFISPKDMWEF